MAASCAGRCGVDRLGAGTKVGNWQEPPGAVDLLLAHGSSLYVEYWPFVGKGRNGHMRLPRVLPPVRFKQVLCQSY